MKAKTIRYRTHSKKPEILYLPQEAANQVERLMNLATGSSSLYELQEKMNYDKYFGEFQEGFFEDISIKANYIRKASPENKRALKLQDDIYTLIGAYEIENLCEMTNLSKKDIELFKRIKNKITERTNKLEVRVSA
jgi:hypothetical protein